MTRFTELLFAGKSHAEARSLIDKEVKAEIDNMPLLPPVSSLEEKIKKDSNIAGRFDMYNEDFSIRWRVVVRKKGIMFEVHEEPESLFSNPLASGLTLAEAIQGFLDIEKALLDSL